jgi:hypothetical protein
VVDQSLMRAGFSVGGQSLTVIGGGDGTPAAPRYDRVSKTPVAVSPPKWNVPAEGGLLELQIRCLGWHCWSA